MSETSGMPLAALQHMDSFFPSGAVSFSWGLEALSNRGLVKGRQDLFEFIAAQLTHRWASIDRAVLVHAHTAAQDIDTLMKLDWRLEAQTLALEQREGSQRMGAALLSIHGKLCTPGAEEYASRVREGHAAGHLPVVQGQLWGRLGFDALLIQRMAAHGLCTGLLSAAVRLSVTGHVDAQHVLVDLHPVIEQILTQAVVEPDALNSFVPQTEIASMNHETDDMRLFAN